MEGMSELSDDPIGDAIRADAEAARAEMRAEAIICPSCRVNMADLPEGHSLALSGEAGQIAECPLGAPAELNASSPMSDEEFKAWQAAACIRLWEDFNRRMDEVVRREIIGEGPAEFTGLLDVLRKADR
jgi:hypothetical protein